MRLEEERRLDDNGEPETDAAFLNRKLEKLKNLNEKDFHHQRFIRYFILM